MTNVPHVPPPTASHHFRTIQAAILKEASGASDADELVFAINAVLATIYAEGFSAGRVHATDAHYLAQGFAEHRKVQSA